MANPTEWEDQDPPHGFFQTVVGLGSSSLLCEFPGVVNIGASFYMETGCSLGPI